MMDQDSLQRAEWEHFNTDNKMVVTDDDVDVIAAYQGEDPYVVADRLAKSVNSKRKKTDDNTVRNERSESEIRSRFCSIISLVICAVAVAVSIVIGLINYGVIG